MLSRRIEVHKTIEVEEEHCEPLTDILTLVKKLVIFTYNLIRLLYKNKKIKLLPDCEKYSYAIKRDVVETPDERKATTMAQQTTEAERE